MQEFTSANTSINSTKVPVLFKRVEWVSLRDAKESGKPFKNVDIGGGKYDTATEYLKRLGVKNIIFDPHNRDEKHNENVVMEMAIDPADTATLSNVLNVIKERDKRIKALKQAKRWATNITFITVYEGNKSGVGRETKRGCWQENRRLADYLPEVQEVFSNVRLQKGYIMAW